RAWPLLRSPPPPSSLEPASRPATPPGPSSPATTPAAGSPLGRLPQPPDAAPPRSPPPPSPGTSGGARRDHRPAATGTDATSLPPLSPSVRSRPPKTAAAGLAKRAFPDPAHRAGAAKASDDKQAPPAAPLAAKA
ncbi:hypothetical protein U9M48_009837, partial [Paspalum notatum var. saurae]